MAENRLTEELTPEQMAAVSSSLVEWANLARQPVDRDKATGLLREICAARDEPPIAVFADSFEHLVTLVNEHLESRHLEVDRWRNSAPDLLRYSSDFHGCLSRISLALRSRQRLKAGLLNYHQRIANFTSKVDSALYQRFGVELSRRLRAKISYDSHVEYLHYAEAKYLYFARLMGERFDGLDAQMYFDCLLNLSVTFFVGRYVFVCEKPRVFSRFDRLHSTVGPALGWDDGTGFHYLHGVEFETSLWETVVSGRMTFHDILKIRDKEQRHQALWCNPDAFLALGPRLVNRSESGNELYRVENTELNEIYHSPQMWFLRFYDVTNLPPDSCAIEEIDPAYAEANPEADSILHYHREFLEVYSMTYAEERQYWLERT